VAVHLDLDVLDPTYFRSLYFTNPEAESGAFEGVPQGRMRMKEVVRLLKDVEKVAGVVGITIAEHLPWDALALKNMLKELPLLGEEE
jgi:arginase